MKDAMVSDLRDHTYCCAVRAVLLPVVVLPIRQVDVYSRHFSVQHCYVSAFLGSFLCWNALAKASPFGLESLCVGAVVVWPVSLAF